ncbi:SlyX family protein [Thermodesulfobacteriota bacterium]
MEERLIALETKVAHQEYTISELNEVVYQQQKQIDQLEETCRRLAGRVKALMSAGEDEPAADEPPPHY